LFNLQLDSTDVLSVVQGVLDAENGAIVCYQQKFGQWGRKPGCFIMLPIFGPGNDRDTLGIAFGVGALIGYLATRRCSRNGDWSRHGTEYGQPGPTGRELEALRGAAVDHR